MCALSSLVGVIQWEEVVDVSHCVIRGSSQGSDRSLGLLSLSRNTENGALPPRSLVPTAARHHVKQRKEANK